MRLDELQAVYRGKKVLITGHTGFKGSWLCILLKKLGADVVGLSLKPSEADLFHQAKIESICQHYCADIRDFQQVDNIVSDVSPDMVFHLAAQALVGAGRENPVETFSTNVQGTVHVLEACRGVKSVVIASSDKCYAPSKRFLTETDRLGGLEPYSASKAALEHVVRAYRMQYFDGKCVATVRSGNVVGGGDWSSNRLIPDVLRALQSQSALELRHPRACRAWQYVLEPLWGYTILAALLFNEPDLACSWNFGPNSVASVSAVVHALGQSYGETPRVRFMSGSPPETMMLRIDSSKALQRLGWQNQMTWEEALRWTAEDYRIFSNSDPLIHMQNRVDMYGRLWLT